MSTYWLSLTDVVDPDWWAPLDRFVASLDGRDLPPVDPADFAYSAARVDRAGLPLLHVYRNVHTRKCLNIDDAGTAWRFVGKGQGAEGYEQLGDAAEALSRAEIERGNYLATHTRAKCEDAWLAKAVRTHDAVAAGPVTQLEVLADA